MKLAILGASGSVGRETKGLQNRLRGTVEASWVGSIPIHPRHLSLSDIQHDSYGLAFTSRHRRGLARSAHPRAGPGRTAHPVSPPWKTPGHRTPPFSPRI